MSKYMDSPRFIWKIENFSTIYKKLYPSVILIGGLKWQLIFSYYMENGTERNRLILECLTSSETLPVGKFNVRVSLFNLDGTGSEQKNATYELKCKEWCVWTDSVTQFNEINRQKKDVIFLVTITPTDNIESLLNNHESVEEVNNESTCMKSLTEDFGKLFNDDEHSDFVLKCDKKSFYVHKGILSSRSEFFAAMLRCNMKEANEGIGQIEDIEPDILELVLLYLYTGKIPELSMESLKKIYTASERFVIEPLKDKCLSLFLDNFITDSEKDSDKEAGKKLENGETNNGETEVNGENKVNGETEVVKTESREDKENRHLKELFMTREWRSFCLKFPDKAQEMCKYYLLQK